MIPETRQPQPKRRLPRPLAVWGMRWGILLSLTGVALQDAAGQSVIWGFMIFAALSDLAITLFADARLARRREKSRALLEDLEHRLGDDHVAGNR